METTLTENDKKLLYILGFIVIAFIFGWLIIRPMVKKMIEVDEDIIVEKELKLQNEAKVMNVGTAESLIGRFESDFNESVADYYDPMDSSEIDKLFTSYVLSFGLYAKDLTISMPQGYVSEVPYINSDLGKAYVLADSSDSDSSDYDEESEDGESLTEVVSPLELYQDSMNSVSDTTGAGVTCAEVTIVMTGNPVTEQKLLDDILTNPSVRVTGFAWDDLNMIAVTNEDGTIDIRENTDRQLTINLNVYMCNKGEE